MTKDEYLDMCNLLGSDPVEDEIPPDFDDLSIQSQVVILIFSYIPDKWDTMSGSYLGKDISNLFTIYDLFSIDKSDWLLYTELLNIIIDERIKSVNNKIKKEVKSGTRQTSKKTPIPS